MSVLPFRSPACGRGLGHRVARLLDGFSIEVTPRAADHIEDFRKLLPEGTRICIAHIEGTPIDAMISTAKRLRAEGFAVMPHVPARLIPDRAELRAWLERYRTEADVTEALVLAGAQKSPAGRFRSSIQLLETGLFEDAGFMRLHVAGHPEGNRAIAPCGGNARAEAALLRKVQYARSTNASMAIVSQVSFGAAGILAWDARLRGLGVTLPLHVGVAGPARLHALLKHGIASGAGPSFLALQERAADVTGLRAWIEPDDLLRDLSAGLANRPDSLIARVHVLPTGGVIPACRYVSRLAVSAMNGNRVEGEPRRSGRPPFRPSGLKTTRHLQTACPTRVGAGPWT